MRPEIVFLLRWIVRRALCFAACARHENFLTATESLFSLAVSGNLHGRSIYRGMRLTPIVSRLSAVYGNSSTTRHHGCCLVIKGDLSFQRSGDVFEPLQIGLT